MKRDIIHLHIPAFFIAVSRSIDPRLKGRPVAVAQPGSARSLILSTSCEAKKEGVLKGIPVSRAVRRCPGLKVIAPDPALTIKAAFSISKTVSRYTPVWESARPGHIYMDLTGTGRLWGAAKDAASTLRKEIGDMFSLTGTAGVSGNKMVSSIASRMASCGVTDIDHGREKSFMAPLRVGVVPGIGASGKNILLELNIRLVRELACLDMGDMRMVFGKRAHLIHERAIGIDPRPVYPAPSSPSVSEKVVLSADENDDQRLLSILFALVEKCAFKIRKRGLVPKKAGLLIRYADGMEETKRMSLKITDPFAHDFFTRLETLFLKSCTRRVRVRYMRVWFFDLAPGSGQLSLFPSTGSTEKKSALVSALDRVRERYGDEAIGYGRAHAGSPLCAS